MCVLGTKLVANPTFLAIQTSAYAQSYLVLVYFFLLSAGLCAILATVAYITSLSTAQDAEKRSEYECGFAPFDNASRLPFDVHFFLVALLFLIFDVEVALLFPYVMSVRLVGWFGFYLVLSFLLILALGFLYEWKRGALVWTMKRPAKPQSTINTKKS